MRISSLQMFSIANNSMGDASQSIAKTQEQLSTGQKILTAADDPVAAAKVLELEKNLSQLGQYGKNIDIAENNLSQEETTLDSVTNLLQRVRELAVKAGNTAVFTGSEYEALASEVDSRLDELTNLMNTRNSAGDYIFAGYSGGDKPFVGDPESGFQYQGTDGHINIKVSDSTSIASTDSGKSVFMDIPSAQHTMRTSASDANTSSPAARISVGQVVDQDAYDAFYPEDMVITFGADTDIVPPGKNFTITERSTGNVIQPYENHVYTGGEELIVNGVSLRITGTPSSETASQSGDSFFVDSSPSQDILTTLARFSDAMKNLDETSEGKEALSKIVADTLDNLDNAQDNISKTVATLGARMNTLDSTREQHLDTELSTKETMSNLKDLDYAEAASRLASQTLVLEAAQATFVRVTKLTLFSRM